MALKKTWILVFCISFGTLLSQTFSWSAFGSGTGAGPKSYTTGAMTAVVTATTGGGTSGYSYGSGSIIGGSGVCSGSPTGLFLEMSGGSSAWTAQINVAITFSAPICGSVSFTIYDINEATYSGDGSSYYNDQVVIGATDGTTAINPSNITYSGCPAASNVTTSGNNKVITGKITNNTCNCQSASITINSGGSSIKTINLLYKNGPPNASKYGILQYQNIVVGNMVATSTTPTVSVSAPALACGATSTTLTATTSAGSPTFTWTGPGGSTISSPTASATAVSGVGIYTVVVNPGACSNTATFAVNSGGTPPSVTASVSNTITCSTTTAQVIASTASAPVTYTWSGPGIVSGVNSASATVNTGGTYNYTVNNTSTGCSTTGTVAVTQNTSVVTASASVTGSLNCGTTSAQVIATSTVSPASYTWSGPGITAGTNSATATVNAGGTYNYTVANTSNGCKTTGNIAVSQNTTSPVVSTNTGSLTCSTSSVQISANTAASPVSYTWSGPGIVSGAGTGSITVNAGGTYNYTVTNTGNNCSTTGNISVSQNTVTPTVSVAVSSSLSCNTSSTQVVLTTTTTPATYTWNGPGIVSGNGTATITVNAGGSYNYTVTGSNGCKTSGLIDVVQNTVAVTASASVTSSLSCTTTTAQAIITTTASPATYTWSGPGIVSGNGTATITTNAGGTYNYTVANTANGCSTTGNVSVAQNSTAITASASASTSLTCNTSTVTANITTTASPVTYTWSGPGIVSGNGTSGITVNTGGTYNYTVLNTSNGCSTTGNVSVSQNTVAPLVSTATSGTLTCNITTVQASASTTTSPALYTWSGPGIVSGAGTGTIMANAGGTYNYTVTNATTGCSSTGALSVSQNTTAVSATASATSSITCATLTAQGVISTTTTPATYTWSGSGIVSGSNSATVTVNAGGAYGYTVTNNLNGCNTTGVLSVTQNITPVSVTASTGASLSCVTLTTQASLSTTSTPVGYSWSGPGIVSGNGTSGITVNSGGTYNFTVTNTNNGCSATGTVAVIQNTTPPSASANNATLTCSNPNATINGAPLNGVSYDWSGPGISGSTTLSSITATASGSYTLITTSAANGCTNTAIATIASDYSTSVPDAGTTQTLVCGVTSVTLSGSATPAGSTANWLGGVCGSSNSFTTTACAPGTYTLEVTHPVSGCTSTATVSVLSSTNVPQAVVNPVTNSITCTNSVVTIGVTLSNSDPVDYSWSGPGITGATNTSTTTANMAGTYTVSITNTLTGCQSVYTTIVPTNTTPVTVNVSPSSSITCGVTTTTLSATPTGTNYSYGWAGPGTIQNGNTENPVINTGGDYTVTITDNATGCNGTYTINVPSNTVTPTLTLSPNSVTTTCAAPNVTITSQSSADPNTTYTWTTPSTGTINDPTSGNPVIGGYGVFTVTATDNISGCVSAVETVTITPDSNLPVLTATAANSAICSGSSTTLSVTGADSYTWSANAGSAQTSTTTVSPTLTETYTVTGTNTVSGCSNTTTVSVNVTPTPSITVSASSGSICAGNSVTLTLSGATSYTVDSPGLVTNGTIVLTPTTLTTYTISGEASGCSAFTETITIDVNSLPVLSTSDATTCAGSPVTISASGADTYTWQPGNATGSGISVSPGTSSTYTVTGTNTITGCTSAEAVVNVNVNALPTVTATANPNTTCSSGAVSLSAQTTATSYTWTSGNGVDVTNQNQQTVSFPASGLTTGTYVYTVVVTDGNTCVSLPATTTVTIINVPNADFSLSDLDLCQYASGNLSVNTPQAGVVYDWNINGQTISNTNPVQVPASVTANAGTYTVSVVAGIGTCTNQAVNTLTVYTLPLVTLVNSTTSACENTSAHLDVASPVANYTYTWIYNSQVVSNNTGLTINPLSDSNRGTYTVTVTDNNGCTNATTGFIDMQTCETYVPEIFTPNGDGKNDGFVIRNIENYPNNNLKIFNRWGNLVYEKDKYLNEFEGFANTGDAVGKSKLPAGTYYVILNYGDEGKTETYNGYLLLQY